MSLAEIMCRTWYEVDQEDCMKLGMNMAKISGRRLFMAIDDLHDDGYRFSFPPNGDCLRGTYEFLMSQRSKNQKLKN